jgi:hypothetical protein
MSTSKSKFAIVVCLPLLSACGLNVPEKSLLGSDTPDAHGISPQGAKENLIVSHIICEIEDGLYRAQSNLNVPWLSKWGTSVTLTLTWEDQSALNPSIAVLNPFENIVKVFPKNGTITTAQSFGYGLGASGSANATRVETIQFTYSNQIL